MEAPIGAKESSIRPSRHVGYENVKSCQLYYQPTSTESEGSPMSNHSAQHDSQPADPLESIVHSIPVVIPAAGALMIFLLAFIAVFMA
jgi:hypothetical protein